MHLCLTLCKGVLQLGHLPVHRIYVPHLGFELRISRNRSFRFTFRETSRPGFRLRTSRSLAFRMRFSSVICEQ